MTALTKPHPVDYSVARLNMVEGQLRPNKVTDSRILSAMADLPRELFVPSTLVGVAYMDENVPLISGRSLMQPMVLARLIQAAGINESDRVLELAPATGYSSLVLASLSSRVISVEPNAILYKEAESNANQFAPGKIQVLAGAPIESCVAHAPFDVIFINGSVEFLPEILFDQLADGGRLVAVVRRHGAAHAAHTGQARLYSKKDGEIAWKGLFDANIPLVPGFAAPQGFVF